MMRTIHLLLLLPLFLVRPCSAHLLLSLFHTFSPTSAEAAWLWGWVWGTECSLSIVDRSPPLTFHSRPASFGPEFDAPLLGYVIPLSSFTVPCSSTRARSNSSNLACPSLCHIGPHHPDPKEHWIALVQRGDCSFAEKEEAQRLGARAVIVGGQDPDLTGYPDTLVNMFSNGDASDITTPSTYITYADYSDLMLLIDTSTTRHAGLNTLSLLITVHYSTWEWYSPILTFIVILILPSCLTFLTLLIHRIRVARAAQRDRAPEHLVKSLPCRVWNGSAWEKHQAPVPDPSLIPTTLDIEAAGQSDPGLSSSRHETLSIPWCGTQLECAICLYEFVKGDRVRELPCHHIFHLEEIDTWLISRKKLCPVCKADVTQPWQPFSTQKASNNTDTPATSPTERTPLLHDQHEANLPTP